MDGIMDTLRSIGPASFAFCLVCTCFAMPHMNGRFHANKYKDDEHYKVYREKPIFLAKSGDTFKPADLVNCKNKEEIFTGRGSFVMKKNIKPKDGKEPESYKCDRNFLDKMRDGFAPYDCYCAMTGGETT